jgi:hypothetical protein
VPFRLGKARAVLSPVLSSAEKKVPICRQVRFLPGALIRTVVEPSAM